MPRNKNILITVKRFYLGLNFFIWFVFRVMSGWCGLFKATFPAELRERFEKIGATYIKFGQVLAMRPDITPPRFLAELQKLLDAVPPFSSEKVISILEAELKAPVSELFSEFQVNPVGAASFAQVHLARLPDGSKVAVKIQRPNLIALVTADLRFLRFVVFIIDATSLLNRIKLHELYHDFAEWTMQELDLEQEAAYIERFNKAELPTAVYPKVFWRFTSRRVLTMSFFDGYWLTTVLKDIETGAKTYLNTIERKRLAANLFHNALFQFFDIGLFNADPHAGNICVFNSNLIGYVDFGIVGQIDNTFREIQIEILDSLQREDLDDYYSALFRLLTPPAEDVDMKEFERAVKSNARNWFNSQYKRNCSFHEASSATLFSRNFLCARRFGVSFSELSARFYRAAGVLEHIIFKLDPEFKFGRELKVFFARYRNRRILNELSPAHVFEQVLSMGTLLAHLPNTLSWVQDALDESRTDIRTAVSGFQTFFSHFTKAIGWLLILGGVGVAFYIRLLSKSFLYAVACVPIGVLLLLVGRHLRIGSVQPNRKLRGGHFDR